MIPQLYAWMENTGRLWSEMYVSHLAAALLLALILRRQVSWVFSRIERWLRRVGRRPVLALLVPFLLAVSIRVALLPVLPVPEPKIQDEFSYLLGADTFASGRLTNPAHPLWMHFEALHVNQIPTYQSMYPPAQALVLAAGQVLTGIPWLGVLVSGGLMCAAITWMLRGWMSSGWALLGGLLAALQYTPGHYWMDSYWGGTVAALGGALLLGALPRLLRSPRPRHSVLLALGAVILANSRPYEGLALCIAVAVALLLWLVRRRPDAVVITKKLLLPGGAVLAVSAAAMMFYFWRGTGNPLRMPYQVNWEQYHITRLFLWQTPRALPHYHHPLMAANYYYWELAWWPLTRTRHGLWMVMADKLRVYYLDFVWPLLLIYLLGIVGLLKSRKFFLPLTSLFFFVALMVVTWHPMPHYAAPATALVFAVLIFGLRYLRLLLHPSRFGLQWSRGVLVMLVLIFLYKVGWVSSRPSYYPEEWYEARYRLTKQLQHFPGRHLVLVPPSHELNQEWVYNAADIDAAKIVWARDMRPAENEALLRYYKDRRVWRLWAPSHFVWLQPYVPSPEDNAEYRNAAAFRHRTGSVP